MQRPMEGKVALLSIDEDEEMCELADGELNKKSREGRCSSRAERSRVEASSPRD
jgi:hypothetical protein